MFNKFRDLLGLGNAHEGFVDSHSIQGRKPSQEDACYLSPVTMNGQVLLVADGVGGHAHGEFASNLCVQLFRDSFESSDTLVSDPEAYLRQLIMQVAVQVHAKSSNDPEYRGTGSTISGFYLWGRQYVCFNVGDSRVYHFSKEQQLHQLTKDQTVVQDLIDRGEITPEEARHHPHRNMMNSAIGQELDEIRIEITPVQELQEGACLLACSDGVNDALTDAAMQAVLSKYATAPGVCQQLVQAAYDAGGLDNITAVLLRR
jgi:protein phosphatase